MIDSSQQRFKKLLDTIMCDTPTTIEFTSNASYITKVTIVTTGPLDLQQNTAINTMCTTWNFKALELKPHTQGLCITFDQHTPVIPFPSNI